MWPEQLSAARSEQNELILSEGVLECMTRQFGKERASAGWVRPGSGERRTEESDPGLRGNVRCCVPRQRTSLAIAGKARTFDSASPLA